MHTRIQTIIIDGAQIPIPITEPDETDPIFWVRELFCLHFKSWRPYLTPTQSYMRRRRWWGWQYRVMTDTECTYNG